MSYEEIVESRIREAMEAGVFRNLDGEGKPLPQRPDEQLAGDNWIGFKILSDHGMLPEWLLLAREIEALRHTLDRLNSEHARLAASARAADRWARLMPAIDEIRKEFEQKARLLRRKQDRYNYEAPSIHLERPAIWVEREIDQLDSRIACEIDSPHQASSS